MTAAETTWPRLVYINNGGFLVNATSIEDSSLNGVRFAHLAEHLPPSGTAIAVVNEPYALLTAADETDLRQRCPWVSRVTFYGQIDCSSGETVTSYVQLCAKGASVHLMSKDFIESLKPDLYADKCTLWGRAISSAIGVECDNPSYVFIDEALDYGVRCPGFEEAVVLRLNERIGDKIFATEHYLLG